MNDWTPDLKQQRQFKLEFILLFWSIQICTNLAWLSHSKLQLIYSDSDYYTWWKFYVLIFNAGFSVL